MLWLLHVNNVTNFWGVIQPVGLFANIIIIKADFSMLALKVVTTKVLVVIIGSTIFPI